MTRFRSTKATLLFPLALLLAAVVTQADANSFHDPNSLINRNVGSAPNPTRQDIYPALSRMLKEQGKVGLGISLADNGTVSDAWVERSSGFARLDEAAIQYMKAYWHYRPVNKPMPTTVQADVTFKLQ